ncbi:MAG: PD-(D/E)XK nuclease family protein [Gemmataceae bacterium]
MRDPRLFATEAYPLRASSLPNLVICPMRAFLQFQGLLDDAGNASAEMGTLVHEILAHWHANGNNREAAIAAVGDWRSRFPLVAAAGRYDEALAHVEGYRADPRNQARPILIEQKVRLALPPHETDPTGQSVIVQGALDQVRGTPQGLKLYDVKTGRTEGIQMLDLYAYQIAAYCVMATELLGEPVAPGALIRTAGYLHKRASGQEPDGVFFAIPWNLDDCREMLDVVRLVVANIRRGEVNFGPGYHCVSTCPARSLQRCLPVWK